MNILKVLNEFSYNLSKLSPKPIDNLKIVLPYENYKQVEYELYNKAFNPYEMQHPTGIKINTVDGFTLSLSCKELEEANTQAKLQECFKILSSDNSTNLSNTKKG